MREELVRGNRSVFSRALDTALSHCLARGEQAMLFINRRGHSTLNSCRACGKTLKCDNCDVSLTYHRAEDVLRCHYCGLTQKPPDACPSCGSPSIKFFGAGTQRWRRPWRAVPASRGALVDLDTTRGKDAHAAAGHTFRRGGEARC